MEYEHLDRQLAQFAPRLEREVRLAPDESRRVSSLVAAEIAALVPLVRAEVRNASHVPIRDRVEVLLAARPASWC